MGVAGTAVTACGVGVGAPEDGEESVTPQAAIKKAENPPTTNILM